MFNLSWDDIKTGSDTLPAAEYNDMVTDQKTRAIRTTGSGDPVSTPSNIGDIYIDTTNDKMYISTGTSSVLDWRKVITQ